MASNWNPGALNKGARNQRVDIQVPHSKATFSWDDAGDTNTYLFWGYFSF